MKQSRAVALSLLCTLLCSSFQSQQEHTDDTDAVEAESLTEVLAFIVSDIFAKLIGMLGKLHNELLNDVPDNDCHHLSQ